MATPPTLDFDQLLAPIPGENPAGVDLRENRSPGSPYDTIKDARALARELEKRQEQKDPNFKDAEARQLDGAWRTILEGGQKLIATRSKDLEITAFVIEALLRQRRENGIAGLRDGFRLARGLVERYWDKLYPLPDEDGVATRVAPLAGLNGLGTDGTLIKPLRMLKLAERAEGGPLTYDDYERSLRLINLDAQGKAQRLAAGDLPTEAIIAAIRKTPPDRLLELFADLQECREEFMELGALLDAACGQDAPPSSSISGILEGINEVMKPIAEPLLAARQAAEPASAATGNGAAAPAAAAAGVPQGAIGSREDALQVLSKVAEYFRRSEPHSLVSYVIEEAVRRARLPLPELVAELIPDAGARKQFFINSGIRPPQEPEAPKPAGKT